MSMGKNTEKMPEKDKQRKYKIHEQIQKKSFLQCVKENMKKREKTE